MKNALLLSLAALAGLGGVISPARCDTMARPEAIRPIRLVRVWVPPVYRTVVETIWVEGRYETIPERIWIEPVYDGQYGDPDCYPPLRHWGIIVPGHWEIRYRSVWVPAHEETVSRRMLVTPGHWEWIDEPRPIPLPEPRPYPIEPPKAGVEGYQPGDSAKPEPVFTPLEEWPK